MRVIARGLQWHDQRPPAPQHLPNTANVPLADLLNPHFQPAAPNRLWDAAIENHEPCAGKGHYLHTHRGRLTNEKSPIPLE